MTIVFRSLALAAAALVSACASDPEVQTAQARSETKECVAVTGSNVCRKPDSGNPNALYSISGEDLRRSGGPITGAKPGNITSDGK